MRWPKISAFVRSWKRVVASKCDSRHHDPTISKPSWWAPCSKREASLIKRCKRFLLTENSKATHLLASQLRQYTYKGIDYGSKLGTPKRYNRPSIDYFNLITFGDLRNLAVQAKGCAQHHPHPVASRALGRPGALPVPPPAPAPSAAAAAAIDAAAARGVAKDLVRLSGPSGGVRWCQVAMVNWNQPGKIWGTKMKIFGAPYTLRLRGSKRIRRTYVKTPLGKFRK